MRAVVLAVLVSLSSGSHATLIDRGNGLLYDTTLNITWMKAAGLHDSGWQAASEWAAALVFAGYSDWRLPWASVSSKEQAFGIVDCRSASEAGCRDNEMAYMYYYNLHGSFGGSYSNADVLAARISDLAGSYWSATKRVETAEWYFDFNGGSQNFIAGGVTLNAWAVRDGAVSPLSEPPTLLLIGLIGAPLLRLGMAKYPRSS